MEQQMENHMRLPPPVSIKTSPDSTFPLHQPSHKHLPQPAQQAHPHSILSPPFGTNGFYGGSSPHYHRHQQLKSSLSPPPLSAVPAYSPPSYAFHEHDPSTLKFPKAPSTELAPLQLNAQEGNVNVLPSLASLTASSLASPGARCDIKSETSYSPPPKPRVWPSGNPYSAYYSAYHGHSADSPAKMEIDSMSSGTRGPLSPENMGGRASSVSLDDPDVKMAAEALGDLKANFVSSPRYLTSNTIKPGSPNCTPTEAEPLLSLVMTSGSVLAKPIEGTVSAYNTTKNRTPGFIKAPVEYVEGVVGSGFHMSGIEGGVRWFFRGKSRQHSQSDVETGENSHKRRRVNGRTSTPRRGPDASPMTSSNSGDISDQYDFLSRDSDRRMSMSTVDSLPAYDDARSPAYTENATPTPSGDEKDGQVTPTPSRPASTTPTAWQSRLIMSTSGLSIAMSEESLRSLKYCLTWLRWANGHIGRVIAALKEAVEQWERQTGGPSRAALSQQITALRAQVLKTLQGVIETVSTYAGGALPDNARSLVRRHLTSLPQRFRIATQGQSDTESPPPPQADASTEEAKEQEVREGAQRVLVLAKEGLDMMAQVSGVLHGTIVSAEEWCDRLGRRTRTQTEENRGQQDEENRRQQDERMRSESQSEPQSEPQPKTPTTVPFAGVYVLDDDVKMG